jgi:ABC-type glycerol-3-phosphate transport system substrate-binding protein
LTNRKDSMVRGFTMFGLAACVALAACGRKEPPAATPPEPKLLVIWQTESDQGAIGVLRDIEEAMEREQPGLDVQIETVNWNSLSEKMTAAIQTGGLPDLAHVQPFMLTSLWTQDLLAPLTDVARAIHFEKGSTYDALLPMVTRDEQIYGLPYAVGTTFWAYRRDIFEKQRIAPPKTWAELLAAVVKARKDDKNLVVLLPGASPFFIDQLFAELAANNGGRLFNPSTGDPELNTAAIRGVVRFFIDLKATGALDPDWASQTYQDQFAKFPSRIALLTPVTYARAAVAIQKRARELQAEPDHGEIPDTQQEIGALDQPAGPLRIGAPTATIDCEPYVLFRAAERRGRAELARKFLREFYAPKRYVQFVTQVPIHLTPIQTSLRNDPEYTGSGILQAWSQWQDHTDGYLKGTDGKQVRPILMPDPDDTKLRSLFEFQNEKILSGAVQRALSETPKAATSAAADSLAAEIAQDAQCRAVALLTRIGSKVSASAALGCSTP